MCHLVSHAPAVATCCSLPAGTPLGDPIESGALRKAVAGTSFAAGTSFTAGATKTLTGHLEGTAGLAGLLLGHVALSQQFAHGLRYR